MPEPIVITHSRRATQAAMTEAELHSAVTTGTRHRPGLCTLLGLAWYHTHNSRRSPSGFPDLVIVGDHGALFRELKTATGRLTTSQEQWGGWMTRAGLDWDIWRPADLVSGRILRELEAIR